MTDLQSSARTPKSLFSNLLLAQLVTAISLTGCSSTHSHFKAGCGRQQTAAHAPLSCCNESCACESLRAETESVQPEYEKPIGHPTESKESAEAPSPSKLPPPAPAPEPEAAPVAEKENVKLAVPMDSSQQTAAIPIASIDDAGTRIARLIEEYEDDAEQ